MGLQVRPAVEDGDVFSEVDDASYQTHVAVQQAVCRQRSAWHLFPCAQLVLVRSGRRNHSLPSGLLDEFINVKNVQDVLSALA